MSRGSHILRAIGGIAIGVALGFGARTMRSGTTNSSTSAASAKVAHASVEIGASNVRWKDNDELFSRVVSTIRNPDFLTGRAELHHLLEGVDASVLPVLIERAQKLPLKFRRQLVAAIFGRWLEIDRAGAEAWIRAAPREAACYEVWASVAPDEVLKLALGSTSSRWLFGAGLKAMESVAGNKARDRVQVVSGLTPSKLRDLLLTTEFEKWAKDEPAAALEWVAGQPHGRLRESLEQKGVIHLVKTNPTAALDRTRELIPDLKAVFNGNGFVSSLAQALAESDATKAMEFAQSLPPEFQQHPLIAAASAWAKTDPLAALEWSRSSGINIAQDFEYGRVETSTTVLRAAFEAQPEDTVNWLLNSPDGNDRNRWLQYLLDDDDFLETDKNLGQRLFDSLPAERQRQSAHDFGWYLADSGRVPDLSTWNRLFPDESTRAKAFAGAMGKTFERTPMRAEAILAELPAGAIRDQTLAEFAMQQTAATPQAAASRAMEIGNEMMRYDALEELLRRWSVQDRPSAMEWIKEQENLPRAWVAEWLSEGR
jgi:hypothetical protein